MISLVITMACALITACICFVSIYMFKAIMVTRIVIGNYDDTVKNLKAENNCLQALNEAIMNAINQTEITTNMAQQDEGKGEQFSDLVQPVIEWLAKNYGPHTTVIITNASAELLDGQMSVVAKELVD